MPPGLLGGSFRALFVASLVGIVVAVHANPGAAAVPSGQAEHSVRGAPKHGSAYNGREQYEDDAEANRQRLRHDPNDEEALRVLGFDYGELGEFADALAIESRAVKLKPADAKAWVDVGMAYDGLEKYRKAIAAEKRALQLNPGDGAAWAAWTNISAAYGGLKRYEKAIVAEKHALRLRPNDGGGWRKLVAFHYALKQYGKAVAAGKRAVRLNPDDEMVWSVLGAISCYQHDRALAAWVYQSLKKLNPQKAKLLYRGCVAK